MKKLLSLFVLGLLCSGFIVSTAPDAGRRQTYYYFGCAMEQPAKGQPSRRLQLLYTDLYSTTGGEGDLKRLSSLFIGHVNKVCATGSSCMSELKTYTDAKEAEEKQSEIVSRFERTGKYDVKRIEYNFK